MREGGSDSKAGRTRDIDDILAANEASMGQDGDEMMLENQMSIGELSKSKSRMDRNDEHEKELMEE